MGEVITISRENVRYEKDHRLLRCPKCGKWNRVGYQNLIDKIFIDLRAVWNKISTHLR